MICSNRKKTFEVRVTFTKKLIVRALKNISIFEFEKLIQKKSKWISKKLNSPIVLNSENIKRTYSENELFYFLGSELSLNIKKVKKRTNIGL